MLVTQLILALAPMLPPQVSGALFGVEEAKLTANAPRKRDYFGISVALDGPRALIGAEGDGVFYAFENIGAAYVFDHDGTAWSQKAQLLASDGNTWDPFGSSVDLQGNTAVVSAPGAEAAYVFELVGTDWVEEVKLMPSAGLLNADFGQSLDLDGDLLIVGRPEHKAPYSYPGGAPAHPGSAFVFARNGSTWIEEAILQAPAGADGDAFGYAVALSGQSALVVALNTNLVHVFERSGTTWSETAQLSSTNQQAGSVIASVSLDGDLAALGNTGGEGRVHLFSHGVTGWTELITLKPTPTQPTTSDLVSTVDLQGGRLAVGNSSWSGGVEDGSTHVFEESSDWQEVLVLQSALTSGTSGITSEGHRWGPPSISGNAILVGAPFEEGAKEEEGAAVVFRLGDATPVAYCTAGSSASGCRAGISGSGVASATQASGFQLLGSDVEGGMRGLFFFGPNGRQAQPWGNGSSYQCLVPPVSRTPAMLGGGTAGACDGSYSLDLNALWHPGGPKSKKNPGSGASVQAQLWYRDPFSTSNQTTSLSDAIEFLVSP